MLYVIYTHTRGGDATATNAGFPLQNSLLVSSAYRGCVVRNHIFSRKTKTNGNGILENIVRLLSEWGCCHEMNANQPPLVRLSL